MHKSSNGKQKVCLIMAEGLYLRLVDELDLLGLDDGLAPALLLAGAKVSVCGITDVVEADLVCLRWHGVHNWRSRGGNRILGILRGWSDKDGNVCWNATFGDGKTRFYDCGGKGELVGRMVSYGLLSDATGLEE